MSPSKDEPPSGPSAPKLSIKGFSLSSKSGAKPKPPPPSSSLGKRPRSTFQDHDNDGSGSDAEADTSRGKHEVVTGFAEGGAISRRDEHAKKTGPVDLVIPKISNKDWWAGLKAKKGKNLLPPEVQRQMEDEAKRRNGEAGTKTEGVDVVNSKDGEIQWGLTVRKREVVAEGNEAGSRLNGEVTEQPPEEQEVDQSDETAKVPKTADEEALAALLGNGAEKKGPDLVIPTVSSTVSERVSDENEYRRAIAAAPDASTLEDYERVPVEEFGAALLRGMGWKGEKKGKVRDVKRRQNLLGLGAKELKDAEELGAWVQKSDVKRLKDGRPGGDRERRPKASEYKREKERRDERRDERGGGGYRGERERERDRRGYRERDRRR